MIRERLSRLAGLFSRRRRDRDLDDEVRFHLEMTAAALERQGMSAGEARQAALRHFGGVTQMKEAYRDQRGVPVVDIILRDARYALRTLARTPGFTLAALLTLALGIGANAAMFSVVNAVLLRPLPYPQPERIVQLVRMLPSGPSASQTGARYLVMRDRLQSVDGLAAYSGVGSFNLVHENSAEFIRALGVSKEYFAVFGMPPALGQPFTAEHDTVGGPDVAILTHGLWTRLFGADAGVIGRAITLGDRSFTVVGVMPASFQTTSTFDVLLPLRPSTTGRGGGSNYTVAGRLRPGVTIQQASAEAETVYRNAVQQEPTPPQNYWPMGFTSLQASIAAPVRPALLTMLGAVGLLLLIACANTANLLLARASGRGREIAVRAALGAGRGRIIGQLLTESVVLAIAGGALGVLAAYVTLPGLLALTPGGFIAANQQVRVDATVLVASLGLAVITGVLFGLAPAVSLSKRDLVEAFKDDGGRATSGRRAGYLRQALAVGEVALCMLLLIGAGLLLKTFMNLRSVDPGFDTRGVLTARMSMQGERYATPADIDRFYAEGLDRIRRLPGVRSAAVANGLPLDRALNLNVDTLDGPQKFEDALTDWRYATADYFSTMKIPIVAGRAFTAADRAGAPPVAVVSEEFARRFFPGTSALGHHIRVYDADGAIEIVGIAKDLREGGLRWRVMPVMYVPVAQTHAAALKTTHSYFQVNWVVRADEPGAALARRIAEEIRALDPRQPFSAFTTIEEMKGAAAANERFQMTLLGAFATIGLVLAAAGIYGLLAYSVAQRTREFGIRLALGATRHRLLTAVLWQGASLALVGVAIGAAAAAAATRTLRNFVWGVSTLDPATFVLVAVLLIIVAALASVVPALRAVRLDPVSALRQ